MAILYPKRLFFLVFIWVPLTLVAQREIPLYRGAVPNTKVADLQDRHNSDTSIFYRVYQPSLRLYFPESSGDKVPAVIICAGGGYAGLNIGREGYAVAEAFTKAGVAAIVLKYRLPDDKANEDKSLAPLQDAQAAIRLARDSATVWGIDSGKIGIMGFSAGGHLAASAGTHFRDGPVAKRGDLRLRPDFMILVYPVISFGDAFGHIGSRDNLLGKTPSAASIQYFSNELHVTKETPPAFLVHSGDDAIVPVANSIRFYEALQRQGVPASLHIYDKGGHGFGATPSFDEWFGRVLHWMQGGGWIQTLPATKKNR